MDGVLSELDDGVAESFTDFYSRTFSSAVGLAYLLSGDRAAASDLAQDAYAAMFRRWDQVREPDPYLRTCVRNAVIARARRHRPDLQDGDRVLHDPGGPISDRRDVVRALATLSPRQREAVVLRYYADLSEREIAAALGCRSGTVKSLLHRALRRLQGLIDEA